MRKRKKKKKKEDQDEEDYASVTGCRLWSTGIGSGSTVDTCSHVSPVHASRGRYIYVPWSLAVTCLSLVLLEEYICRNFWEATSGGFPYYSCWFDSGYMLPLFSTRCRASVWTSLSVAVLWYFSWSFLCLRCRWQFCGIILGSCHEEQFLFIVGAKGYFFIISKAPRFWQPLARCRSGVQDTVVSGRSLPETFPYSSLFGSTVDTCLRQLTRLSDTGVDMPVDSLVHTVQRPVGAPQVQFLARLWMCVSLCNDRCVVRWCIICGCPTVRQIPMVLPVRKTIETPQLQYVPWWSMLLLCRSCLLCPLLFATGANGSDSAEIRGGVAVAVPSRLWTSS